MSVADSNRLRVGIKHPNWKGGVSKNGEYLMHKLPGHHRAGFGNYVLDHILIAEAALGKPLPPAAIVHHTDEQKGKVDPHGLVICPDRAYHVLIHKRSRALAACGHADWRKCSVCKKYDDPANMYIHRTTCYHRECESKRRHEKYANRTGT